MIKRKAQGREYKLPEYWVPTRKAKSGTYRRGYRTREMTDDRMRAIVHVSQNEHREKIGEALWQMKRELMKKGIDFSYILFFE